MPLELQILTGSRTPIYRQIVDQICKGVATEAFMEGDALPSVRALAEQLVVNPNTVARAYSELVHHGIVEAQAGKGFFITKHRQVFSDKERTRRLEAAFETFINEVRFLHFSKNELRQFLDHKLASFGSSLPPGDSISHQSKKGSA